MTDMIADLIEREGGSKATNDPNDGGGRTQYGISEKANPEAWTDGKVTEAESRAIYEQKYLIKPRIAEIANEAVKTQLFDWAVTSGPAIAIQNLQLVLALPQDGVIGPDTLAAANKAEPRALGNALAIARCKMICRVVQKNPTQIKFLTGWISRALEFVT